MTHPYLRQTDNEVHLALRVQPRASKTEWAGFLGDELKLRVTAPPVDSAANLAVVEFLAAQLGCPKGAVRIVRGQSSKRKVVAIRGVSLETVFARLPKRER